MPLVEERPSHLPPDQSRKETITLTSAADGCQVAFDVYAPAQASGPLPLLLAPHPITWTAEQDYHGGLEGLMRQYHRGYYGLPDAHGILIAMPHGHHHREALCSLAGPEQIDDMLQLIDGLTAYGYSVDPRRVYACGLSMGAHEALVLAGRHPDRITAVCVFNPIVDLAAWHADLAASPIPEIREYNTAARIAREVGGTPAEVPEAYAWRSALELADGLARVPTLIFWSDQDIIVPRQVSHHTYALYRRIKARDVTRPIAEYNHTWMHGPLQLDQRTRWQLHEWCDYDLALRWLLGHRR
jgi:pimeloyl-ACP methyl ester carboxylesterase